MESIRQRVSNTTSERFLDGLTLGEPLGRGGMSHVREAATADGRRVAVKLPRVNGCNRAVVRALVRREFGFLDGISHPNVVKVLGLVRIPGGPNGSAPDLGIVMEYLDGGDLVSLSGCPPRVWAPLAAQAVRAVDHLHRSGIVHGDLKPRNVMLRNGDVPCLIDFALAARIGGPAPRGGGTVAYRRSKSVDMAEAGDDVYALAVLVYELWVGALPFGRNPGPTGDPGVRRFPELKEHSGLPGLRHVAGVLADILNQTEAALSGGIGPLRHALESAVAEL